MASSNGNAKSLSVEEIDGRVVNLLSDKELIDFGIIAIGDRISLKDRCTGLPNVSFTSPEREVKRKNRKELLDMLRKKTSVSDEKVDSAKGGRPRNQTRVVTMSLRILKENTVSEERESNPVKSPLGEKNTISVQFPVEGNYQNILDIARMAFFPNNSNPVIGGVDGFSLEVVNHRNVNIQTDIIPFSFGNYVKQKKIPGTPKLYLLCWPIEDIDQQLEIPAFGNTQDTDIQIDDQLHHTHEEIVLTSNTENVDAIPVDIIYPSSELDTSIELVNDNQYQATSPSGEIFFRRDPLNIGIPDPLEIGIPDPLDIGIPDPLDIGIPDDVNEAVEQCIKEVQLKNIFDPVEVLRLLQSVMIMGRSLDVEDETSHDTGKTNFILVDRSNLLETAFSEIRSLTDLRFTLEVQFYGEAAQDLGGPRKEFFTLILQEIKDKYFNPVREWSKNYGVIGRILGLSILQNGKLPKFLDEELLQSIFNSNEAAYSYIDQIRLGLNALGFYKLTCRIDSLIHFFTLGEQKSISLKMLTQLLNPVFSPEGSNIRKRESEIYSVFIKYLREAASGRRGNINLSSVLKFVTGCEEEPVLGFKLSPTIHFYNDGILPTANTCINRLTLPLLDAIDHNSIFDKFDYAFANEYFGLM